jgi:hypothetical protein
MEELLAQLSQLPGLRVVARTAVPKYKDSLKDVATIGRELQVGTILEGSIRNLDTQVRVNVQVIDVASQGQRWSQEYTPHIPYIDLLGTCHPWWWPSWPCGWGDHPRDEMFMIGMGPEAARPPASSPRARVTSTCLSSAPVARVAFIAGK